MVIYNVYHDIVISRIVGLARSVLHLPTLMHVILWLSAPDVADNNSHPLSEKGKGLETCRRRSFIVCAPGAFLFFFLKSTSVVHVWFKPKFYTKRPMLKECSSSYLILS